MRQALNRPHVPYSMAQAKERKIVQNAMTFAYEQTFPCETVSYEEELRSKNEPKSVIHQFNTNLTN